MFIHTESSFVPVQGCAHSWNQLNIDLNTVSEGLHNISLFSTIIICPKKTSSWKFLKSFRSWFEKERDLRAQRKSGSICVYYRLQQEPFENLFIPGNKLLPQCVSVRYRMAFLTVNLQDTARISPAATANHFHSLAMYICLCYEYACHSHKDHHNRAHSLVLCCTVLQHQAPSTLD